MNIIKIKEMINSILKYFGFDSFCPGECTCEVNSLAPCGIVIGREIKPLCEKNYDQPFKGIEIEWSSCGGIRRIKKT